MYGEKLQFLRKSECIRIHCVNFGGLFAFLLWSNQRAIEGFLWSSSAGQARLMFLRFTLWFVLYVPLQSSAVSD